MMTPSRCWEGSFEAEFLLENPTGNTWVNHQGVNKLQKVSGRI
jgi:hypothetical protein